PSTLDRARVHAALPLEVKISVICEASRVTSSRSACRSAWISPLAAEAALPLSRTASLASRVVSRTVSRTVSLIGPDVLDTGFAPLEPEKYSPPRQRSVRGKVPLAVWRRRVSPAAYSRPAEIGGSS